MISSLVLTEAGGVKGVGIYTSRSTDGGLTWGTPVAIPNTAGMISPDKNWIVCDNTATSPFYGNCYTEWDDNGAGNRMEMSRSTDGGLTWSVAGDQRQRHHRRPAGRAPGWHGHRADRQRQRNRDRRLQLHQRRRELERRHHDRHNQAPHRRRQPARGAAALRRDRRRRHGLRRLDGLPLPQGCKANDIVISHSLNATGTSWSAVTRVPIDATGSGIDHFIPGLAVNKATSGATAQLGLTYYFYPKGSTQLSVGFTSSANAGSTWSTPQTIISGMTSTWAATTSQGRMVGDYISTSYGSDNLAHGIFGAANTPTTGAGTTCSSTLDNCVAPIDTFTPGLASGSLSSANDPGACSRAPEAPTLRRSGTSSTTTEPSTETERNAAGSSRPVRP